MHWTGIYRRHKLILLIVFIDRFRILRIYKLNEFIKLMENDFKLYCFSEEEKMIFLETKIGNVHKDGLEKKLADAMIV